MAGGVLGRVGVVKIGDLLVPVRPPGTAQVGPRDERLLATHLDLGLEDERPIRRCFVADRVG